MKLDIRKATKDDLPTLLDLYRVFDSEDNPLLGLPAAEKYLPG